MKPLGAACGIEPPIGRPDAEDVPAETSQHLFTDLIAVSSGGGSVIRRPVAFDAGEESASQIWVTDTKIDPESGDADLRHNTPATPFQLRCHGLFERRLETADRADIRSRQGDRTALGIVEESLEVMHGQCLGACRVDLVGRETREHDKFLPGTRDGDVQTTFASIAVQRTEVHRQLACGILPEGDREKNDVTLIALNVLQVLDDGGLDPLFGKKPLELRLIAARGIQKIENQRLLLRIEGDHSQRRAIGFRHLQPCLHSGNGFSCDSIRFWSVGSALAAVIDTRWDFPQMHGTVFDDRRRKSHQPVLIVMMIGEGDQRLASAAIVPSQIARWDASGLRLVENALKVFLVISDVFLFLVASEEVRRRQLLGIADDDRLAGPRDGTHSVPSRNLRRLIEDHNIEQRLVRWQILSDRQG